MVMKKARCLLPLVHWHILYQHESTPDQQEGKKKLMKRILDMAAIYVLIFLSIEPHQEFHQSRAMSWKVLLPITSITLTGLASQRSRF